MTSSPEFVFPTWLAPPNIMACCSLRIGGSSTGDYDSFNLADHVGDQDEAVMTNRQRLKEVLKLHSEPKWLQQIHGTRVVNLDRDDDLQADAAMTSQPDTVCSILTADCLPLLLCDKSGTRVAAIHAGWKGLLHGVIPATIQSMRCPTNQLLAWMGPAIGPQAYQVGEEVRAAFLQQNDAYTFAFLPDNVGQWMANLYQIAYTQLSQAGISDISGANYCTYMDTKRFFSFRRNNQTGRMASLIWMQGTTQM